jgi:Domain of unknown function (DUF4411)
VGAVAFGGRVLTVLPKLLRQGDKRSGGDPFVIVLAMVKSATVVTEEKPTGNIAKPRIPDVCDALGVHCLTPKEYSEAQGWTF